ncbi:hypothetical protein HPP92_017619 [Vanilla planifolia]|uniref:DUF4220 domain-containing protein n=1 Tax=Vanilla planifolia TaxID=51239 RepID=A0A835Q8B6_VANPL|nr:hypothetical protein HPP92_017619 [Vanilla planifolia]
MKNRNETIPGDNLFIGARLREAEQKRLESTLQRMELLLRFVIPLSLVIQLLLPLAASFRKNVPRKELTILLWLCYLAADFLARYSIGVLSRIPSISNSFWDWYSFEFHLYAFWAPFLLLHLGGPDNLSSLSLEDNKLWLRQLFLLIAQLLATALVIYRFSFSFLSSIAPLLLLAAGVLRCVDRILALYTATMDSIRKSLLEDPHLGPDYYQTLDPYAARLRSGLPTVFTVPDRPRHDTIPQSSASKGHKFDFARSPGKRIRFAYELFLKYQGVFVNSIFSDEDCVQSRPFFESIDADLAFKVLDTELSFAYDALYTKAAFHYTKPGLTIRYARLAITIAALILISAWTASNSNKIYNAGIGITMALVLGSAATEIVPLVSFLFSDWIFLIQYPDSGQCDQRCPLLEQILLKLRNWDKLTWSNSVSQYNLIRFCLYDRRHRRTGKILSLFGLKEKWNQYWLTRHNKLGKKLKDKLFDEMRHTYPDNVAVKKYSYYPYRSNFPDTNRALRRVEHSIWEKIKFSFVDREGEQLDFDESILIWHIATDLCNRRQQLAAEKKGAAKSKKKAGVDDDEDDEHPSQMAKRLSDYVVSLLILHPGMLSERAALGTKRFLDTYAELAALLGDGDDDIGEAKACDMLLMAYADVESERIKGDRSKSVLWDGCVLARRLMELAEEKRWAVMWRAWVEMLCFAALSCGGYYHADRLREGGELVTFVCFLMLQLGRGDHYKIHRGDVVARVGPPEEPPKMLIQPLDTGEKIL